LGDKEVHSVIDTKTQKIKKKKRGKGKNVDVHIAERRGKRAEEKKGMVLL